MKQKIFNKKQAFRFKRFARKAYSAFNSMHRVVNIGVVTACMLTFAHTSETAAQSIIHPVNADGVTEKSIDTITVTASRVEVSINRAAKLVTVITRDEINRAPVQSIQDLLNYSAGIDVLQRSGHGVQADVTIRGGSLDQTAILLNGINLTNPQTGHYSFDIPINLSDIEHIEIIRGPSSIIYGASAFSGGINIITRKDADTKLYTKLQAGNHQLLAAEAGAALKTGIATNRLSASYSTSNGYMRNSDYDIFNMLLQSRLDIEKSKIDIQFGYNNKQYGANTFYSAAYPDQYDKTNTYFASIKGETGQKLKFKPSVYWNRHNDCFQLFREGTPILPDWYKEHNYHQTNVYGSNFYLQYASALGTTSLGAEFRNENILSNVLGKPMNAPDGRYTKSASRTNISYALEHNLIYGKLSVSIGLLANYNTSLKRDYRFYPSVNAGYNLLNNLKTYASWTKATRMPTFTDLYSATAIHTGNSDLSPENSEAFELGFRYSKSFFRVYATAYLMKGKKLIDWVKDKPEDKWQTRNLTQINKKGLELGVKFYLYELLPQLASTTLDVEYTRLHQDKKIDENVISNYVLNHLRDKFTARLHHSIYKEFSANWNFRWQKRMGSYLKYEDLKPTTQEAYPAFSTVDMCLNWKVNKQININLSINNLFDKRYFDLGNIPQAGFWMIGGLSYTL